MAEITEGQLKLLSSINTSLAGRMSEVFSTLAKRRVEVKVDNVEVVEYSQFLEKLPHFLIISIFNTELSTDQILLIIHPALAYYILDKVTGGKGEIIPLENKKLTDIERAIFEKFVFSKVFPSWEEAWERIAGSALKLSMVRIESDPYLTRRMEGKFVYLAMECNFEGGKEIIIICIPHRVAETIGMSSIKEEFRGNV
jgi:flagellar motor switch protein FliM